MRTSLLAVLALLLLIPQALPAADPPRLQALEKQFRERAQRKDLSAALALARKAAGMGEQGIAFCGSFMNDPARAAWFNSPEARHEFSNEMALYLGSRPSAAAIRVLRQYYWGGSRRTNLARPPFEMKEPPLATTTDETGERWALVQARYLCLTHSRDGVHWSPALFTGMTHLGPLSYHRPTLRVHGGAVAFSYPKQAPLGGKVEVRRVELPVASLTSDQDGDGLYDLEEAWCATDPAKPDTDRDGLLDGEDANPLVMPQPISDRRAIGQAMFRWLVRDDHDLVLVHAKPEQRQEFLRAPGGFALFVSKAQEAKWHEQFGYGYAVGWGEPAVDGGQATVDLFHCWGPRAGRGYRATLRKLAPGLWVITRFQMTYVS